MYGTHALTLHSAFQWQEDSDEKSLVSEKKIPPLPWELFMIQIINILTPSTDKTIQPLKLLKIKFENLLRRPVINVASHIYQI